MTTYDLTDLGPGEAVSINVAGGIVGNDTTGGWLVVGGVRQTLKFNARYVGAPSGMFFTAYSVSQLTDAGKIYGTVMLVPNSKNFISFTYNSPDNVLLGEPTPTPQPYPNAGSVTVAGVQHATLDGVDLNYATTALGWVLNKATDRNAAGQVVGYGTKDGVKHAFLLTPKTAAPVVGSGSLSIALRPVLTVNSTGPCEVLCADRIAGPWKTRFLVPQKGEFTFVDTDADASPNRLYRINK